jgi:hypothetical protein
MVSKDCEEAPLAGETKVNKVCKLAPPAGETKINKVCKVTPLAGETKVSKVCKLALTIQAKIGLIWFSSFRGEDLNLICDQNMPNLHHL